MLDHGMSVEWQSVDIAVRVKESHDESSTRGKIGVIRSITVSDTFRKRFSH